MFVSNMLPWTTLNPATRSDDVEATRGAVARRHRHPGHGKVRALTKTLNLTGYPEHVAPLTMRFVFLLPRLGSGVRRLLV